MNNFPIITILTVTPLVGALLLFSMPAGQSAVRAAGGAGVQRGRTFVGGAVVGEF